MAKELPNYDITGVDFVWKDTTVDRKILFYKNTIKVTETKNTIEIRRKRPEVPFGDKATLKNKNLTKRSSKFKALEAELIKYLRNKNY